MSAPSSEALAQAGAAHALELRAGDLRLAVRADLGGSIAGLWLGNTPVMRSTEPESLSSARQAACYPLVPYSNRLAHRRFRWQGREYTTERNFDDNPHSVHGVGWLRRWELVLHQPTQAELRYRHEPDAHWPFAFEASQRFVLTPQALVVTLAVSNTADVAQPIGLGWHPYFPKRARSHLRMAVSARWDPDAMQLPVQRVAQQGIDDAVEALRLDHCFDGWSGEARLDDEVLSLRLRSNLTRLVVYTPPDKAYYCVEPVSHVSDAIHAIDPAAAGLCTLLPGERCEASMTLEIAAR